MLCGRLMEEESEKYLTGMGTSPILNPK